VYDVVEQTTLGRRVARLCDIFWKKEAYCHFLSGKCTRAPSDMTIYKITDDEIKAMKSEYHHKCVRTFYLIILLERSHCYFGKVVKAPRNALM